MQAAEQELIDGGETVDSLMARAGAGAADWIWRISGGRPITVLCGPGNNGGDGYVIARELHDRGASVSVIAPLDPKTDAARAARAEWSGPIAATAQGHVFVDCLFGTGLGRPMSSDLVDLLTGLADKHDLRVAVDLPSGVESDTGAALNARLPAYDLTVALGAWKRAHWSMPAAAFMGERRLVDIGVNAVEGAAALAAAPRLSRPGAQSHKYSRGMVLVVGGEMPGAAIMAAQAAQHGGAGYVKLVSAHSHPAMPLDIVHDDGADRDDALADDRVGAMLIGPGLGRDANAREHLVRVLATEAPKVLDADALMLLERGDDCSGALATPHEGELARLCEAFGIDKAGKLDRARALQDVTGMTVLAKGADNILVGEGGRVRFFPPAPSWLSTAGTGDVLAGLAASRLSTGAPPFEAAEQAVMIHAEAARIAGSAFSATGLIAALPTAYGSFL